MSTNAEVLDACSTILEGYGARPVPPADPTWQFAPGGASQPTRCRGCGHYRTEHGATGECWHLADHQGPDCTCGQPATRERAA